MHTATDLKTRALRRIGQFAALLYSLLSYLFFLLTFLYFMGFVGNVGVPKSIDSGTGLAWPWALASDILLISLFALQHSLMARKSFKDRWRFIIPAPIERATYVLVSSAVLALLCGLWQPITSVVWKVESPVATGLLVALYWLGWAIVLVATFLFSHFELFGIKQALAPLLRPALVNPVFRTPTLYKVVRHPMYLGFLIAFWATPQMTVGHLVFALTSTLYILIGTHLEEKDLVTLFGDNYRRYQKNVAMLLPFVRRNSGSED